MKHALALDSEYVHSSPGIAAIYRAVSGGRRNEILDLGKFRAANFNFFTALGGKFHFENFDEAITDALTSDTVDSKNITVDSLLGSARPQQKFDIVLLWDTLNFLDLDQVARVMNKLAPYTKPSTLFHSIQYVGNLHPSAPCQYTIENQNTLKISAHKRSAASDKRFTTNSFLEALPKLAILGSYINHTGMSPGFAESIISYREAQKSKAIRISSTTSNPTKKPARVFTSAGLAGILTESQPKTALLDLGSKVHANVAGWEKSHQYVYCEHLSITLMRYHRLTRQQRQQFLGNAVFLDYPADVKFSTIVAWDLFNYLDEPTLYEIGNRISPYCAKHTKLVMLSYRGNLIPELPQAFVLSNKNPGRVAQVEKGQQLVPRNHPTPTSLSLRKALPHFQCVNTSLINTDNGPTMTEYTFEYQR